VKPKKRFVNITTMDPCEHQKLQIFLRLNELARNRGITLIYEWIGMRDYAGHCWDDIRFQSIGAVYDSTRCVFCGQGPLSEDDRMMLDKVPCDRECFRKRYVDSQGPGYLPPTEYRPPVIVIYSYVPGSLDIAVMCLAWALGVYRRSLSMPSAPDEWIDESAYEFADRLVFRLETTYGLRRLSLN
jgi:hypothetical protein